MLFFGYIVTEVKYNDLQEDIIKVVSSISDCIKPLPKMIIGLENAKKYALDNNFDFDILEHTFPNGDMWTFKKTEKRELYEEDIDTFKKRIVEYQGNDVTYYYVNIYALKYNKAKKLYNILFNNVLNKQANYIIIDRNMLYMCLDSKNVIGISFTHLEYIGISRDKIIDKLKAQKTNRLYFTTSKKMWKLKDWFYGREYIIASIFETNTQKRI
jgi:hypothetical protein